MVSPYINSAYNKVEEIQEIINYKAQEHIEVVVPWLFTLQLIQDIGSFYTNNRF